MLTPRILMSKKRPRGMPHHGRFLAPTARLAGEVRGALAEFGRNASWEMPMNVRIQPMGVSAREPESRRYEAEFGVSSSA
jgi:hypothetical protein